nr:oligosaccharide flippase family protein [Fervidobacterium pennivorans]
MIYKDKLTFLYRKGFFHIFTANVINKIIAFGLSIVIVRLVPKEVYGQFSYAYNILSMFLLANGLGVNSGLIQFGSTSRSLEEKVSYFNYAFLIGFSFNVILGILVFLYSSFFNLPIEGSTQILKALSFVPMLYVAFELIQIFLRVELRNKEFAFLTNINTIVLFLTTIIGGYFFQIYGIVSARYVSYILSIIIGTVFLRNYKKLILKAEIPASNARREFLKYSFVAMMTNSISQVLYLIDTFLVGLLIASETVVASYKVATLIPFNLNFIPGSIIIFVYPYFARQKDNKEWVRKNSFLLTLYLGILNAVISLLLFAFAPLIVKIIFGRAYMDAVVPFRILSVGYFIAGTFGSPFGNIITSLGKIKFNFYNALISGTVNIFLDIVLIKYFGSVGAAIATVLVILISSVNSSIFLKKLLS